MLDPNKLTDPQTLAKAARERFEREARDGLQDLALLAAARATKLARREAHVGAIEGRSAAARALAEARDLELGVRDAIVADLQRFDAGPPAAVPERFVAAGRVTDAAGFGIDDVVVVAVDAASGADLGESSTDARGYYEIPVASANGPGEAGLLVRRAGRVVARPRFVIQIRAGTVDYRELELEPRPGKGTGEDEGKQSKAKRVRGSKRR